MPNYLIIMRGVPGSGKSSFVIDQLVPHPELRDPGVCSADFYFYDEEGSYRFDRTKLAEAHQYCWKTFLAYVSEKRSIIIDNTNIIRADFEKYIIRAEQNGYIVRQHLLRGKYQNVHNVPDRSIQRMATNLNESLKKETPIPPLTDILMPTDIINARSGEAMHKEALRLVTKAQKTISIRKLVDEKKPETVPLAKEENQEGRLGKLGLFPKESFKFNPKSEPFVPRGMPPA